MNRTIQCVPKVVHDLYHILCHVPNPAAYPGQGGILNQRAHQRPKHNEEV